MAYVTPHTVHADGMGEDYTDLTQEYDLSAGSIVAGIGRRGSHAWRSVNGRDTLRNNIGGVPKEFYFGVAWFYQDVPPPGGFCIFAVWDNDTPQMSFFTRTDGHITVWRGSNSTFEGHVMIGISDQIVDLEMFNHFRGFGRIDSVIGAFSMKLNGVPITWKNPATGLPITGTNIDTSFTVNQYYTQYQIGGGEVSGLVSIADDWWVDLTTDLGDVHFPSIFPNAAGDVTDFTPVGAATVFDAINEHAPNDDTDYAQSSLAGDRFLTNMDDVILPGIYPVIGIKERSRKTDTGDRTISVGLKSGVTEEFGPSRGLGTEWASTMTYWNRNPATGNMFTQAELNAIQCGMKVET